MEIPRDIINNLQYSRFHTPTDNLIRDSAEKALGVLGPSAQKVLISRMHQVIKLPVSDFMSSHSSLRISLHRILGRGARVIVDDIDKRIIQALGLDHVLSSSSLEPYLERVQRNELLKRIGDIGSRHMVHFSTSRENKEQVLSAFSSGGSIHVEMPESPFDTGTELNRSDLVSFLESHVSAISQGGPARIVGDATGFEERIPGALLRVEERLGKGYTKYPTLCLYSDSVCETSAAESIMSSHSEIIFDNPYVLYSSMN